MAMRKRLGATAGRTKLLHTQSSTFRQQMGHDHATCYENLPVLEAVFYYFVWESRLVAIELILIDRLQDEHYFDANGQWIGKIPIYTKRTLEDKETILGREDKAEFLRFMRRMLQWEPEKRATATELCEDPWLTAVL